MISPKAAVSWFTYIISIISPIIDKHNPNIRAFLLGIIPAGIGLVCVLSINLSRSFSTK